MTSEARRIDTEELQFVPPCDPSFQPLILTFRRLQESLRAQPEISDLFTVAIRAGASISQFSLRVGKAGSTEEKLSKELAERIVKFLLWARGGADIFTSGPDYLTDLIVRTYAPNGARAFDCEIMERVFSAPLRVHVVYADAMPNPEHKGQKLGGHLDGCRVGFDLGASDYKLAAVKDGEVLFSTEIPWDPKNESDPGVHFRCIKEGIALAASHLPHLDAIGGSAAGIYVDNEVRIASLFRSVPDHDFDKRVKPLFKQLQSEFGVPLTVINDGDVTALAGAMSLERQGLLGIAMGSSEAAGYLDTEGRITGWLNELAFAPVDSRLDAPTDEWSGDGGVGVQYFSQQAVNRLALSVGLPIDQSVDLPERLKQVQSMATKGNPQAQRLFETIGIYLGYTLPWYKLFYSFNDVLLLGRVTSGAGGEILIDQAKQVLLREFPEISEKLQVHIPDERSRRVGQAVAAASLPALK